MSKNTNNNKQRKRKVKPDKKVDYVGLSNKQHEENKQLKQKEIDFLEKQYAEVCYLKNKIEGLEKENEQLKQRIKELE